MAETLEELIIKLDADLSGLKREEAEERTKMYDTYGDGVKHDTEWDILEKNKIEYKGEHPKQITELLSSQKWQK